MGDVSIKLNNTTFTYWHPKSATFKKVCEALLDTKHVLAWKVSMRPLFVPFVEGKGDDFARRNL